MVKKMRIKPYVKIIIFVLFVVIGVFLILSSYGTIEVIDKKIVKEHEKSILAYEIIDMEKDMTKAINDMIIKSDTLLSKAESNLQTSLNKKIPIKLDELGKLVAKEEEQKIIDDIRQTRISLEPIQNKLLKLLSVEAKTAEIILLYGDMKDLQEKYFTDLKKIINNSNEELKSSVKSAKKSASTVKLLSFIVVIMGALIILLFMIETFFRSKNKPISE